MKATKPEQVHTYRIVKFLGDDMWTVMETVEQAVAYAPNEEQAKQLCYILKKDSIRNT